MNTIYLSLGSNLGDTKKNLDEALTLLEQALCVMKVSSYYETEPVGYADQDWFLNIVVKGKTDLSPHELLDACQKIEQQMKRVKTVRFGPRVIDIDVLLYENFSSNDEALTIPHPRMTQRAFVMVPLFEIDPDLSIEGRSISEVLMELNGEAIRKRKDSMDRVNKILHHEEYREHLKKIAALEVERIFCKHDLPHFLDVCRVGWILALEEKASLQKETVYAAGLLHDVGRWIQYETEEDHALASARLCTEILKECNYTPEEIETIEEAIAKHRTKEEAGTRLTSILYRADKLSRSCYACEALGACKKFQQGEVPILQY
jgi:2-amino-4-hydroxy-6-hydroxymethyldihydropteridine diphosphokinase